MSNSESATSDVSPDVLRWKARMAAKSERDKLLVELQDLVQPHFLGGSRQGQDMPPAVKAEAARLEARIRELEYPDPDPDPTAKDDHKFGENPRPAPPHDLP